MCLKRFEHEWNGPRKHYGPRRTSPPELRVRDQKRAQLTIPMFPEIGTLHRQHAGCRNQRYDLNIYSAMLRLITGGLRQIKTLKARRGVKRGIMGKIAFDTRTGA